MLTVALLCWSTVLAAHGVFAKELPVYPLPPYVKPCFINDPNFNKCAVESGRDAIKTVAKGDAKYRVPKLDPLVVKELRFKQGTKQVGMDFILKDAKFYGIKNAIFTNSEMDFKKKHSKWDFKIDKLMIKGNYSISGQVLLLPIKGVGDAEINLENLKLSFIHDFTFEKSKNGYLYHKILNSTFLFDTDHMDIKLENLFGGDKLLGSNMNLFLNENWREIIRELKPVLSETFAKLITTIIKNITALVPVHNLYPTKE